MDPTNQSQTSSPLPPPLWLVNLFTVMQANAIPFYCYSVLGYISLIMARQAAILNKPYDSESAVYYHWHWQHYKRMIFLTTNCYRHVVYVLWIMFLKPESRRPSRRRILGDDYRLTENHYDCARDTDLIIVTQCQWFKRLLSIIMWLGGPHWSKDLLNLPMFLQFFLSYPPLLLFFGPAGASCLPSYTHVT